MAVVIGQQQIDGRAFHVLGEFAAESFVGHSGLLARDAQFALPDESVDAYESQPPLMVGANVGGEQTGLGSMTPQIVGWVEDLSTAERHAMDTWIEGIRTMVSTPARMSRRGRVAREYTIKDREFMRDPNDGSVKFTKFSCAGFVFWCYDACSIVLLDRANMPALDVAAAAAAFNLALEAIPALAQRESLPPGGPWHLMLPGYLFRALARQTGIRTPYIPTQADAYYP
jgi:hypothetical protein